MNVINRCFGMTHSMKSENKFAFFNVSLYYLRVRRLYASAYTYNRIEFNITWLDMCVFFLSNVYPSLAVPSRSPNIFAFRIRDLYCYANSYLDTEYTCTSNNSENFFVFHFFFISLLDPHTTISLSVEIKIRDAIVCKIVLYPKRNRKTHRELQQIK